MAEFTERYINSITDYSFEKLFETAEIARFTPDQVRSYEDSLRYYRDMKNSLDTAREEGLQEGMEKGIEKGIEQVALNMIRKGMPLDMIAEATGLTEHQLGSLRTQDQA